MPEFYVLVHLEDDRWLEIALDEEHGVVWAKHYIGARPAEMNPDFPRTLNVHSDDEV